MDGLSRYLEWMEFLGKKDRDSHANSDGVRQCLETLPQIIHIHGTGIVAYIDEIIFMG